MGVQREDPACHELRGVTPLRLHIILTSHPSGAMKLFQFLATSTQLFQSVWHLECVHDVPVVVHLGGRQQPGDGGRALGDGLVEAEGHRQDLSPFASARQCVVAGTCCQADKDEDCISCVIQYIDVFQSLKYRASGNCLRVLKVY